MFPPERNTSSLPDFSSTNSVCVCVTCSKFLQAALAEFDEGELRGRGDRWRRGESKVRGGRERG